MIHNDDDDDAYYDYDYDYDYLQKKSEMEKWKRSCEQGNELLCPVKCWEFVE
jgi:hypothetical protein